VTNDRHLAIYLNDHLGGSAVARERCRHARDKNSGNEYSDFLDWLLCRIEGDQKTLVRLIEAVGASRSRVKPAMGSLVEKVARLKRNGRLTGYSPLALYLELEVLSLGVEGKRLLWVTLGKLGDPRLSQFDFVTLEESARDQRDRIESHRASAALLALG
jgi:hypothetical protein